MKNLLGVIALTCLIPTIGWAAPVAVRFNSPFTQVDIGDIFTVDMLADIPEPILGWGLDVSFDTSILAHDPLTDVAIGSAWLPLPAPDGDGLAGAAFPPVVGNDVLLATLTFEAINAGLTDLVASITPGIFTEGFALLKGGFAATTFQDGQVHVTPEPGTIVLLGTGFLGLGVYGWRRRQLTV